MSDAPALVLSCRCGGRLQVIDRRLVPAERAAFDAAHEVCRTTRPEAAEPAATDGMTFAPAVGTRHAPGHTPTGLGFTTPSTDRRKRLT